MKKSIPFILVILFALVSCCDDPPTKGDDNNGRITGSVSLIYSRVHESGLVMGRPHCDYRLLDSIPIYYSFNNSGMQFGGITSRGCFVINDLKPGDYKLYAGICHTFYPLSDSIYIINQDTLETGELLLPEMVNSDSSKIIIELPRPNPVGEKVDIYFNCNIEDSIKIELFDIKRNLIRQLHSFSTMLGKYTLTVDLSEKPGVYYIALIGADYYSFTSMLKQ